MKTSIIIPVYNQWKYTRICIQSLKKYTNLPFEIILVNNGSDDNTYQNVKKYFPNITSIHFLENKGFAFAVNAGMKIANGDVMILLNNDTVPSHNWLKNLLIAFNSKSNQIVGPLSNNVLSEQMIKKDFSSIKEIHNFSTRYNTSNHLKWRKSKWISGFCMMFSKKLIEEIGFFDEKFNLGYFEDIDFVIRAKKAGYSCLVAGDTYVHHFGSKTLTKKQRIAISKKNEKLLKDKWGIEWDSSN